MRIKLTKNRFAKVDDSDYDWLSKYKWCASNVGRRIYAVSTIHGRKVYMHRLILRARNRQHQVDHINWDTLDNRRINLRRCTCAQNTSYKEIQPKGIRCIRGKWQVRIMHNYKEISVGVYKSEEIALAVRDAVERFLRGKFARGARGR